METWVALAIGLAALVAGMSGAWSPCGFAMVESLTPVLLGGRRTRILGLTLFAAGAVLAAAALGALLGLAGAGLPERAALAVLAGLAVLGGLRDAGLIPVPVPQRRGQVPEAWRRELPVAVWTPAYGAMLGVGVLTFQVVSTFWVAAGGALVIGDPVASALCLAMFGVGRVLMVLVPTWLGPTPAQAVAAIAPAVGRVRRLNAGVLAVVALAAAAGTAAAATVPSPVSGSFDPSVSGAVLARAEGDGISTSVVVRAPGAPEVRIPGAFSPSVDGEYLAHSRDGGVRVVRWATGEEIRVIEGDVNRPALDWPYLAYVRTDRSTRALELLDLTTGRRRIVTRVARTDDLGRPAMAGRVLVWSHSGGRGSRVFRMRVPGGRPVQIARSHRSVVYTGPSVAAGRVSWVEIRATSSRVVVARLDGRRPRTVLRVGGVSRVVWGSTLSARHVYATVWTVRSREGHVLRRRWR